MRRFIIYAMALMASSCTVGIIENNVPEKMETLHDVVYAKVADEDTKTFIQSVSSPMIRWSSGDEISVFSSSVNERYRFNGDEGDGFGEFEHKSGNTGMQSYLNAYAVYPYNESNSFHDSGITLLFPSEQHYSNESFGKDAAPMIAICRAGADLQFEFKPLCGYLKIKLWSELSKDVKNITLRAPNARISGEASVYYNFDNDPVVTMSEGAGDSVTLDCGEGVKLGTSESDATEFWITLPPVIMPNGFSIDVLATDGSSFRKTTTKSRLIKRNVISQMQSLKCEFYYALELKYDASSANENVNLLRRDPAQFPVAGEDNQLLSIDYGDGASGSDISHIYDSPGIYDVRFLFAKPITEISNGTFTRATSLYGIKLPESLKKIGSSAFGTGRHMRGDLIIPANGVEILAAAFRSSGQFDNVVIPNGTVLQRTNTFANIIIDQLFVDCDIPGDPSHIVGSYIFQDCNISRLIIGNKMESIGMDAFRETTIGSVDFEAGSHLKSIDDRSFAQINGLQSITLPSSLEYISQEFNFSLCPELESINSDGEKYWSEDGVLFTRNNGQKILFRYPEAKKSDSFDDISVSGVAKNSFRDSPLVCVRLGISSSIADYAFMNCTRLEQLEGLDYPLPKSSYVESIVIGESAFRDCSALKEFTIGEAVDTIKSSAFYGCSSLVAVHCKSSVPPVLLDEEKSLPTFGGNAAGRLIYVPASAVDAYRASPVWDKYKDFIVPEGNANNGANPSTNRTSNCNIVPSKGEYGIVYQKEAVTAE